MYNILVCDDEKDIVSALKIYLGSEGYTVYAAYNGKEALELFRQNKEATSKKQDKYSYYKSKY